MAIISTTTTKVLMPREIADGIVKDAQASSVVASLSGRRPMRFGTQDVIVFNDLPKAEFVEEGAQKSPTTAGFSAVQVTPKKAQVTLRFNEEVMWADEDYQLGVLQELGYAGQTALARALDLGLIHRINPLTGTAIDAWSNYLMATDKKVEYGADLDAKLRDAAGLVINGGQSVNGIAIDPTAGFALANLTTTDGAQKYPSLGFGAAVTNFLGLPVAQSNTVSGLPEVEGGTGVKAIVGDFQQGIRWGVQRQLPIELIRFGDPDGQGDLKRSNQVALRLEIVYGWYVMADRFAAITEAAGE